MPLCFFFPISFINTYSYQYGTSSRLIHISVAGSTLSPMSVQFSSAALQAEPSYLKSKNNNESSLPTHNNNDDGEKRRELVPKACVLLWEHGIIYGIWFMVNGNWCTYRPSKRKGQHNGSHTRIAEHKAGSTQYLGGGVAERAARGYAGTLLRGLVLLQTQPECRRAWRAA